MNTFAWTPEAILRLRQRLGLSQTIFAVRLGIGGASVISNWERGRCRPDWDSVEKLDRLAETLKRD